MKERFAAKGIQLTDPTFCQIVGHWIVNDITAQDAIIIWTDIRSRRQSKNPIKPVISAPPTVSISMTRTELLDHIALVAEAWPVSATSVAADGAAIVV